MTDIERLFISLSLFNTSLGLTNYEENQSQIKKQEEINKKLDKIIELLSRGENNGV